MKALPNTLTQTMFICATRRHVPEKAYDLTLLSFDPTEGENFGGYIVLGSTEVTVKVPTCDLIKAELEALEKARTQVLADAQLQANRFTQQIQQLLCIEHQVQP